MSWFNEGVNGLQSAAAAEIVSVLYRLDASLRCPLVIASLPGDLFDGVDSRGIRANDLVATTAARMYAHIVPRARAQFGARIARIPWIPEETKKCCKAKFRRDEAIVLAALEQIGSKSCAIFRSLSLSRDHIRRAIKMFKGKRRCQVVLSSILCSQVAFAERGGIIRSSMFKMRRNRLL